MATTDPQKIPSTILSRCLHFNLNRISQDTIQNQLKDFEKESISFEDAAIKNISKIADGSMRDALSVAEQCISHGDNNISYENICKILCLMPSEKINEIVEKIILDDANTLMELIDQMYYQSVDFKYILEEIISIFHQTAIYKVTNTVVSDTYIKSVKNLAKKYNEEEIQILYQVGVTSMRDIEYAPDYKSGFEMSIIRMMMFYHSILNLK